MKLFISAVYL